MQPYDIEPIEFLYFLFIF